ncbi:hypothetical protein WJX75_005700 [Coccomyxa subellipsoidea]|uniref:Uncharacterized protein n=1 Tax=Coccomyxa subellipsoidea TaxID=248742 RepID=A0ABR2YQX5_9CHLO
MQRAVTFGASTGSAGPALGPYRMKNFRFRLMPLIEALQTKFGTDLALIQLWTIINGQKWSHLTKPHLRGVVAQTDINTSAIRDPALHSFQQKCCQQGIQGAALGMLGKAWSTGSACVIQNVDNLPHSLHPRTHLEGGEGVADVVYIPIYDQLTSEAGGVQGVLEVLVHSNAADPMVVANTITFVGTKLNQLQMGLGKPQQQHPHPFGSSRCGAQRPSHHYHHQQQQEQRVMAPGLQAGSVAWSPKHERSSSPTSPLHLVPPAKFGPRMSRTTSMRNVSMADVCGSC